MRSAAATALAAARARPPSANAEKTETENERNGRVNVTCNVISAYEVVGCIPRSAAMKGRWHLSGMHRH